MSLKAIENSQKIKLHCESSFFLSHTLNIADYNDGERGLTSAQLIIASLWSKNLFKQAKDDIFDGFVSFH